MASGRRPSPCAAEVVRGYNQTMQPFLETLATLTPAQLQDVQARTAFLLGNASKPKERKFLTQGVAEVREAYDILAVELKERGLGALPWGVFERGTGFMKYKAASNALWRMVDDCAATKRTDRRRVAQLLVHLSAKYMEERGAPITAKTIISGLVKLPHVLDHFFPGYARSGLLHLLKRTPQTPTTDA